MQVEGVHRPAWAEISASAIAHNVRAIKAVVGESLICAVVKANAYGHGAELAAKAALIGGADLLAVAIVDEGIELRDAGVTAPILLLAEVPPEALSDALDTTSPSPLDRSRAPRPRSPPPTRPAASIRSTSKSIRGCDAWASRPGRSDAIVGVLSAPSIEVEGVYTHFSVADGSSADARAFTRSQIEAFGEVVVALALEGVTPKLLHAANSAGALGYPEARLSMVRLGLSLYGYLPEPWLASALEEKGQHLEPALTLRAKVSAVRRVEAGERPSYGRHRALDNAATVATVPFGYADGYPRRLFASGAQVLINAKRYPLAGMVTMDQLLVDCGGDPVQVGDDVVLLGVQGAEAITADEWAAHAGTISWEILCGIGARVPRTLVS